MKRLYLYIFILFVLSVGTFIAWPAVGQIRDGWESRNWPSTTGEILKAEISTRSDMDEETVHTFNCLYTYQVEGKAYQNTTVAVREIQDQTMADLSPWVQKYPPGEPIVVYYNPMDPRQSLLEPGMKLGSWALAIFGGLIVLFGVAVLFYDLKEIFEGF